MSDAAIAAGADRVRGKYDTEIFALLTRAWGEHLHMGLFERADEHLAVATERATAVLARDAGFRAGQSVLEVACGVGGTARYLARTLGVRVEATNISRSQIEFARDLNERLGLDDMITVSFADFHDLPFADGSFDGWWCQEALLYAADKRRVLSEALRVVRAGGRLVLSDLVFHEGAPSEFRAAFMKRLGAHHLWTAKDYDGLLATIPVDVLVRHDWSQHVQPTFDRVIDRFVAKRDENVARVGAAEVDEVIGRLTMQRDAARAGHLGWVYFLLVGA